MPCWSEHVWATTKSQTETWGSRGNASRLWKHRRRRGRGKHYRYRRCVIQFHLFRSLCKCKSNTTFSVLILDEDRTVAYQAPAKNTNSSRWENNICFPRWHYDAIIVFCLKKKTLNNSRWDYPNQKSSLPFLFLLFFYFTLISISDLINWTKTKTTKRISIIYVMRTKNQLKTKWVQQIEYLWFGFWCWCIFPLFRIEEITKNKNRAYNRLLCCCSRYLHFFIVQTISNWVKLDFHSFREWKREGVFFPMEKEPKAHTNRCTHTYKDRMSIFCVFVIQ